jgi:hypothetical protein
MLATTERGMHLGDHADHLVGRGTRPPLTTTAPPRRLIRRITSNKTSSSRAILKPGRATSPSVMPV